jgi:hypothetical protein
LIADVRIYDETGIAIGIVEGLQLHKVPREVFSRNSHERVSERPARASVPLISRAELLAAEPAERVNLLVESLQRQVARVLGYGAHDVPNAAQPLADLGLDSLMAIQLKNRIQTDLGVGVAVGTLLKGLTTDRLARDVLGRLDESPESLPRGPELTPPKESPEQLLARLDELGDTEVDALLADLLPDEEVPS